MSLSPTDTVADRPAIVFKVGGSLLDLPDLISRVQSQLAGYPNYDSLFVIGGGQTADLVRKWSQQFHLSEETAHWLALEALSLNEALLLQLWPELRLVRSRSQWDQMRVERRPALLCSMCFMKWLDKQPDAPPHAWQVTSDSIAALAAVHWQAERLILLKSCEYSTNTDWQSASAAGLVDAWFPCVTNSLRDITWVNLRR